MEDFHFKVHSTLDGSNTLYSEELQESYHSLNGAVQESNHVYIEAGLKHANLKTINILEIGLGTGLNALLSWKEAIHSKLSINYVAIEAYPLNANLLELVNYKRIDPLLPENAFEKLHDCQWEINNSLDINHFTFTKHNQDFTNHRIIGMFDLIYFDAFAPDKQPEMWKESLLEKLFEALNPNGIFVTYCAKGEIRRSLQRVGFFVERIPGPIGKREMLRATKLIQ